MNITDKNIKKFENELTALIKKREAFLLQQSQAQTEQDQAIEQIGSAALESGKVDPGKIIEKQAELKAIGVVLDRLAEKIPSMEAKIKQAKRDYAAKRINQLAKANNKLLLEASQELIAAAEKWEPVNDRIKEGENLRGMFPGGNYPMSIRRNFTFQIKGLILGCVCKMAESNPEEIEPLIKEFEKLGLGKRL